MKSQVTGQLSIFDFNKKKRPFDYSFQRYIGQKVIFVTDGTIGKIVKIEDYYTIVDTGKCLMVGINCTIKPYN